MREPSELPPTIDAGLRIAVEAPGSSRAVALISPPVAATVASDPTVICAPCNSIRDFAWALASTSVSSESTRRTPVVLPDPSVSSPPVVARRRLLPGTVLPPSRACSRIEPLDRTLLLAVTRPFWLTARPASVTLPRSATISPTISVGDAPVPADGRPLVTVPPTPTSTSRPRSPGSLLVTRYTGEPAASSAWPPGVSMRPSFDTSGAKIRTCPPSLVRMVAPCRTATAPLGSSPPAPW